MDDEFGGDDIDFAAVNANAGPANSSSNTAKPQQPKPQALPNRSSGSSILVSPRQKGNPILNNIRALPWEYSDTPADYVLGMTTCALFLSLKYHRLHPEYVYTRIRGLQGKYNLRIILTMVDITNHEDSLKELSKTSLINNVTIILCWSAQEAGRYLELFKSFEGAAPTGIKAHQSTSYPDKLVDFITVPRSINKTDAVGLVSSFGSIRTAVTARPEEIALVDGWGEKKVDRWCKTVREPFRVKKATKRGLNRELTRDESRPSMSQEGSGVGPPDDQGLNARLGIASSIPKGVLAPDQGHSALTASAQAPNGTSRDKEPDADEEAALMEMANAPAIAPPAKRKRPHQEDISDGVTAALAKLRQGG